jgi:putative glutamine amidotransferase
VSQKRPLVAVTAMASNRISGLRFDGYAVSAAVVAALTRAHAVPVMLPASIGAEAVDLAAFDGLVIPGGADVSARLYGGDEALTHGEPDEEHDLFEIGLLRQAIELNKPVLAICRGLQVLNVALGGTLIGDLPASTVNHHEGHHEVKIEPASRLAGAVGSTEISVSTYHHQAIDRLGSRLTVVARAADGCIEAVQHESAPLLAVQWHPEDDAAMKETDQRLFDAFVEGCVPTTR